jgi:hypothetical protein
VSKFISARKLSILAVVVCFFNSPTNAQSLEQNFNNLFERCRMHIETSSIFDTNGLAITEVEKRHVRSWGTMTQQTAWSLPGFEFYVVLTEWTSRDATTRKLCGIYTKDEERLLTPTEQGLLLREFLILQRQLIIIGTHEVDIKLSPIPKIISAAFLLSESNPRGCTSTNTISISFDGTLFSATSGDLGITECKIR